jgi:hypothetical protein
MMRRNNEEFRNKTYSSQSKVNLFSTGVVVNVFRRDEGVVVGIPEGLLLLIIGV